MTSLIIDSSSSSSSSSRELGRVQQQLNAGWSHRHHHLASLANDSVMNTTKFSDDCSVTPTPNVSHLRWLRLQLWHLLFSLHNFIHLPASGYTRHVGEAGTIFGYDRCGCVRLWFCLSAEIAFDRSSAEDCPIYFTKRPKCASSVRLSRSYILVSRSKVKVKDVTMPKSFSAVTLPHLVRLTSNTNTNDNVPIPGAGMLAMPRIADFLVIIIVYTNLFSCIILRNINQFIWQFQTILLTERSICNLKIFWEPLFTTCSDKMISDKINTTIILKLQVALLSQRGRAMLRVCQCASLLQ